MRDDFAILIMSYGRPESIPSLNSLLKSNYTGKWFIVVGDDDPKVEKYREQYGEKCIVFCKGDYFSKVDKMGLKATKVIMFARNACFDIAEKLGLKYFQQLDDDYRCFKFALDQHLNYQPKQKRIADYGRLVEGMVTLLEKSPAQCIAVSFAQGGDFIGGGGDHNWGFSKLRKSMNSWVCSTSRRFAFQGCMNEDVNAYSFLQSQGKICLNIMQIRLDQPVTQTTGSMTEVYKRYGTHVKSYLTVMLNPSACKIGMIRNKDKRLHHVIDWNRCASKIVRESIKK